MKLEAELAAYERGEVRAEELSEAAREVLFVVQPDEGFAPASLKVVHPREAFHNRPHGDDQADEDAHELFLRHRPPEPLEKLMERAIAMNEAEMWAEEDAPGFGTDEEDGEAEDQAEHSPYQVAYGAYMDAEMAREEAALEAAVSSEDPAAAGSDAVPQEGAAAAGETSVNEVPIPGADAAGAPVS